MLPLALGAAALLLLAAASGGGAGGSRKAPAPPIPPRLHVTVGPDPLVDQARAAKAYVDANRTPRASVGKVVALARKKGREDIAQILEGSLL